VKRRRDFPTSIEDRPHDHPGLRPNEDGEIITDELAAKLRQRVWKLAGKKQTPIGQASVAVPPFPVAGL
jgi:hypothetical protein